MILCYTLICLDSQEMFNIETFTSDEIELLQSADLANVVTTHNEMHRCCSHAHTPRSGPGSAPAPPPGVAPASSCGPTTLTVCR